MYNEHHSMRLQMISRKFTQPNLKSAIKPFKTMSLLYVSNTKISQHRCLKLMKTFHCTKKKISDMLHKDVAFDSSAPHQYVCYKWILLTSSGLIGISFVQCVSNCWYIVNVLTENTWLEKSHKWLTPNWLCDGVGNHILINFATLE